MIPQCTVGPPVPEMMVWWKNGSEYFPLWSYDPVANVYAPVTGLDPGRATVVAGPNTVFSIYVASVLTQCLVGSAGAVEAVSFTEVGGTGGGAQPQLQFFIGGARVATLSASALQVNSITEGSPSTGNVFQIYAGGVLVGTMAGSGLVATEIVEGL